MTSIVWRRPLSRTPWHTYPLGALGAVFGVTGIVLALVGWRSATAPLSAYEGLLLGFAGSSMIMLVALQRMLLEIQALQNALREKQINPAKDARSTSVL